MENAIVVLANEGLHLDGEQPIDLEESTFWKNESNVISLAQLDHEEAPSLSKITRVPPAHPTI